MKHVRIALTFIIVLSLTLTAKTWEGSDFTLTSSSETHGVRIDTLAAKDGTTVRVRYYDSVPTVMKTKITEYTKMFGRWTNITLQSVDYAIYSNTLQIHVSPKEVRFNGKDIKDAFPSGLRFTFDLQESAKLSYAFMVKGVKADGSTTYVKISGVYDNETSFFRDRVFFVYEKPKDYLNRYDPDYIPNMLKRLEEENAMLRTEVDALKKALIASMNCRKPIDENKLYAVMAKKKANPEMDYKAVYEALKEEDKPKERDNRLNVSKKEVRLIFNVYFNDFRK